MAVRTAVAAGASVAIAQLLRLEQPFQSVITVVLVTDLEPEQARRLGLLRFVGSVLGAVVGACFVMVLPAHPLSIGLGILVSMVLCTVLRLQGAARVAGLVCGIILLAHSQDPWPYAFRRLMETSLGLGMAVLVSHIPKLVPARPAE